MLLIETAPTARRLTTVAAVREALGMPSSPSDGVILAAIDSASAAIEVFCRRPFGRGEYRETFTCGELPRSGEILPERFPVVPESVEIEEAGVEIDAENWLFAQVTQSLYRLREDGSRRYWSVTPLIVRYTAGYLLPGEEDRDLPIEIEAACQREIQAGLAMRDRDPLVRQEDVAGVGSTSYWVPGAETTLLTRQAEALLSAYIKFV
ncbi:MAG: hypothetical protein AB7P16_28630 [Bradyrhizobium sp.]|uniref:hypothetical protein n=1 Tax=Bradyrhizobium sp. TaxID=376 RepID=UPI003D134424